MNIGISSDVRVRFPALVLKAFTLLKAYFFLFTGIRVPTNIGISSDVRVRFPPLVLKAFTLLKAYFFSIHWLKRPDEYRDIFGCEGSIPSFGTQSLHIVEGLFFLYSLVEVSG